MRNPSPLTGAAWRSIVRRASAVKACVVEAVGVGAGLDDGAVEGEPVHDPRRRGGGRGKIQSRSGRSRPDPGLHARLPRHEDHTRSLPPPIVWTSRQSEKDSRHRAELRLPAQGPRDGRRAFLDVCPRPRRLNRVLAGPVSAARGGCTCGDGGHAEGFGPGNGTTPSAAHGPATVDCPHYRCTASRPLSVTAAKGHEGPYRPAKRPFATMGRWGALQCNSMSVSSQVCITNTALASETQPRAERTFRDSRLLRECAVLPGRGTHPGRSREPLGF